MQGFYVHKIYCMEYNPLDNIDEALKNDFEFWTISEKGDISRPDRTEVQIPAEDLLSQNWLSHMVGKERNKDYKTAEAEFYFAFMEALRRAGYKKITLDVENLHAAITGEK